jgi:VanZ family protein
MAWVAVRYLAWPWRRVLLGCLALALLSEGLQFLAQDRHPGLVDVGIDMAGAVFGLLVARVVK